MAPKAAPTWDLPTRLLHWSLAACLVMNLFLLESGEAPHKWTGYTAVGILALRFIWGFLGGAASRFRNFPLSPRSLLSFFRAGLRWEKDPIGGHNPLASYVYISLWLLVLCLGISGWMMSLDAYWGEEWLEELHENFSTGIEVLLVIHLLGVATDSLRYRRKTFLAMITGRKE